LNGEFFTAKWLATGLQTVTLESNKTQRKAYLKFDPAFKRFEGIDFNGTSRVDGKRLEPVDPHATAPNNGGTLNPSKS